MCFEQLLDNAKMSARKNEGAQYVIWGRGQVSCFYVKALETEKIDIYAYTDNAAGEGEIFCGYPVIRPEDIRQLDNPFILIAVQDKKKLREIKLQISEMKIKSLTIDEFILGRNADKVFANVKLLKDEKSRFVYRRMIEKKLDLEIEMSDLCEENQYFALSQFRREDVDEVFVDLGSYVGDTLEKYLFIKLGTFKKYFAFEPDAGNYGALIKRIERLNSEWNLESDAIIPVLGGVGKKSGVHFFEELDGKRSQGSHFTENETGIEKKIWALDDYFEDIKITFLKADIESYEFDMLQGAENVIKRDRPLIAIAIYHNATDMYNILQYLHSLDLGYEFYVRHHSVRDTETILYAICE